MLIYDNREWYFKLNCGHWYAYKPVKQTLYSVSCYVERVGISDELFNTAMTVFSTNEVFILFVIHTSSFDMYWYRNLEIFFHCLFKGFKKKFFIWIMLSFKLKQSQQEVGRQTLQFYLCVRFKKKWHFRS